MTRDELIETMARAMEPDAWWNADGPLADVADVLRRPSINAATAALTAIEAAGMRVVPAEPTDKMLSVVHDKKRSWGFLNPRELYRIMIDAAQEDSTSE